VLYRNQRTAYSGCFRGPKKEKEKSESKNWWFSWKNHSKEAALLVKHNNLSHQLEWLFVRCLNVIANIENKCRGIIGGLQCKFFFQLTTVKLMHP